MHWSQEQSRGFALAAAVCDDPGGQDAAAGLAPEVRGSALAASRQLAAADRGARRRWIRAQLRRPPSPAAAPPAAPVRALALLAPRVAPELGRAWLARAGMPRAGFVAEPTLVELLCRIAAGYASDD